MVRWGFAALLTFSLPLQADRTIRVPADFPTIQGAIAQASDGDVVLVAPGEYVVSGSIRFHGKAIAVRSEAGPDATVIRMRNPAYPAEATVVVLDEGEGPDSILEGFTITGGGTPASDGDLLQGGGIRCRGASPTIRGNRIVGNGGPRVRGGGIALVDSRALVEGNRIEGNTAWSAGGIGLGGSAVIRGNGIYGNVASHSGGGLDVSYPPGGAIEGNRILENRAQIGGGVSIFAWSGVFRDNSIAGNRAGRGGGVYVEGADGLQVVRTTIADNEAFQGGGIYGDRFHPILVAESIVWGNRAAVDPALAGLPPDRVFACGIDDPSYLHSPGSTGDAPPFLDPANREYRLTEAYPAPGAEPFAPPADGPSLMAAREVDLGEVRLGGEGVREVVIRNGGPEPLVIGALRITGPAASSFAIEAGPLPLEIPSGGTRAIAIRFAPAAAGEALARVEIDANDPAVPAIRLRARGIRVLRVPEDYATIALAIEAAEEGDEVLVGPETYEERIAIRKGIAIRSAAGPDTTSITASGEDAVVSILGPFLGEARIEGFTIRNPEGTGVSCEGPSAILRGNRLLGNGGAGLEARGGLIGVEANRIEGNRGGGIVLKAYGSIRRNRIAENRAAEGGGIRVLGQGAILEENEITGNRAEEGGGIEVFGPTVLRNNEITGNTAEGQGGGIHVTTGWLRAEGDRLWGNRALEGGGVAFSADHGEAEIASATIVGNRAGIEGGGISLRTTVGLRVRNAVVWGNEAPRAADVAGGEGVLRGCSRGDPGLLDPGDGDLRLTPPSACIDAGIEGETAAGADFEGDPRPMDGDGDGEARIDIGADEFAPAAEPTLLVSPRYDFGGIPPGGEKVREIALWNTGPGDLEVRSIGLRGVGSGAFAADLPDLPAVIPALSGIAIPVAFRPAASGPAGPAQLAIDAGAPGSPPASIELTGRGTRTIEVPAQVATLAEAVAEAEDGDRLVLAPGIHEGGLEIQDAIAIEGGGEGVLIDGGAAPHALRLLLADAVLRGLIFSGGKDAVLRCDGGSPRIEGCRIAGNPSALGIRVAGHATIERNVIERNAGGIRCEGGAPLIRENEIRGNAANSGAGIFFLGSETAPRIIGNLIEENRADAGGGGIYGRGGAPYIAGNEIARNRAGFGGGIALLEAHGIIEANEIASNGADRDGGASLAGENQDLIVIGNRFVDHDGVTLRIDGGTVTLEDNEIRGGASGVSASLRRSAVGCGETFRLRGGSIAGCAETGLAMAWPGAEIDGLRVEGCGIGVRADSGATLIRCLLAGNRTGLSVRSRETVTLLDSTIAASEEKGILVAPGSLCIEGSIIWGNGVEVEGADPSCVRWSDVGDPTFLAGEGTIAQDPRFADPAAGDFGLLADSPCIDRGRPFASDPDGSRADMGAIPHLRAVSCAGADLLCETADRAVLLRWDPCAGCTAIRIEHNGEIAAILDPSETAFIDGSLALGRHTFDILFEYPDRRCPVRRCELRVEPSGDGAPRRIRVPNDVTTIQDAIAIAPGDGGRIVVEPGEYLLDAPIRFHGKAVVLESAEGPDSTVLRPRGPGVGPAIVCDAGEGPGTVIRGFTVRDVRGRSEAECRDGASRLPYSGAIVCVGSSPRIEGNWILANGPAGIYLADSSARITGNRIAENGGYGILVGDGWTAGGAAIIEDNEIFGNATGVSILTAAHLAGNRITGNRELGVRVEGSGADGREVEIVDNVIASNGGGIFGDSRGTPALVAGNVIAGNGAGPRDMNDDAGGIAWSSGPVLILANTIVGNRSSLGGAGIRFAREDGQGVVANSIVWGNEAPWGPDDLRGAALPAACLTGDIGLLGRAGNLLGPPGLLAPADPHLLPGSPCIDAGDMRFAPPLPVDVDGDPRIWSPGAPGRIDIGADEFSWVEGPALVAPRALSFGNVGAGGEAGRDLILLNRGSQPLAIRSAILEDAAGPFAINVANLPADLGPGGRLALPVRFRPTARGGARGRMVIRHGDPPALHAVELDGTGLGVVRVPEEFPTIGEAFEAAADGDRILVGPGIYREEIEFPEGRSVALVARDGPAATAIAGTGGGTAPLVSIPSRAGRGTRLEGFTITGGRHSGIRCEAEEAEIAGNWILGNEAMNGGGIYANGGHIIRNVIACNGAGFGGGGIAGRARSIVGNVIRNNFAFRSGGGISGTAEVFEGNWIVANEAGRGGGLSLGGDGAAIARSWIVGNAAGEAAGISAGAGWRLVSSFLCANRGPETVGLAWPAGGGTRVPDLLLLGATLAGNEGIAARWSPGGGMTYPRAPRVEIRGSILWDAAGLGPLEATLRASDVRAAIPSQETGVIASDPLFLDPERWDFRLRSGSPCLDASDLDLPELGSRDAGGDPRVAPSGPEGDPRADMGADELRHGRAGSSLSAPALFRLPETAAGGEVRAALEIANPGEAPIVVAALRTHGPDADAFSVAPPAAPFTLAPGGMARVEVAFRPAAPGPAQAWLRIESDDPLRPEQDVLLSAFARGPRLDVTCAGTEDGVAILWDGPPAFARIDVLRDGRSIRYLPAGTTAFTDLGAGPGLHRYELVAAWGAERYPLGACDSRRTGLFVRGDANGDGKVDLSDAVAILRVLFASLPIDCEDAADVDDDGRLVLGDAIGLLTYLFVGGPAPRPPFPEADLDPTNDSLGCERP